MTVAPPSPPTSTPDPAPTGPADVFVAPSLLWSLPLRGGIASLTILATSARAHGALVERGVPLPSRRTLQLLALGTAGVHVGEAVYAYTTARRAGMPRSAPRWALEALSLGFPALLGLRAHLERG